MKQFILKQEPDKNNRIQLAGRDYHYLIRVRRLAAGEQFNAVLPNGNEALIKIISIDKGILIGETQNLSSSSASLHPSAMILFQALPKGDKMDLIVRQAAESGIKEIIPFISEFSAAKKTASSVKTARWERIIKEARQQSGSKTDTVIREPVLISELLEYRKKLGGTGILFHHKPCDSLKKEKGVDKNSLHEYLYNIDNKEGGNMPVIIAIGPEGGFSDAEAELFIGNDFTPFTVGDTVLRTETAALFFTAAVKIILLEKDSWKLKKPKKNSGFHF